MGVRNSGCSTCRICGAEYRIVSILNRDMQGFCKAWRRRHETACKVRTPGQRRAWARKYESNVSAENSLTVDLEHAGFQDHVELQFDENQI